jgi:nucleoside-diphosphate-sugar epimerase
MEFAVRNTLVTGRAGRIGLHVMVELANADYRESTLR